MYIGKTYCAVDANLFVKIMKSLRYIWCDQAFNNFEVATWLVKCTSLDF